MSEQEQQQDVAAPEDEGDFLEWTAHPMKRKPVMSALVAVFIIIITAIVYWATTSTWFTSLALLVLFLSVAKFYFPTKYRLSDRAITIKSMTQTVHKDWDAFRSYYPDKNGVLLSPFVAPTRLENFRGIYLLFENNRDEVVAFIRRHIDNLIEPDEGEDKKADAK